MAATVGVGLFLSPAALAGAAVNEHDGYPGWKPDLSSEVLKVAEHVYRKLFHTDPEIKAIHAGLECGIIKKKYPNGYVLGESGPKLILIRLSRRSTPAAFFIKETISIVSTA